VIRPRWAGLGVGLATVIALLGLSVALFINPIWVDFELGRAGSDLRTGYPIGDIRRLSTAVLDEIFFGPATFEMRLGSEPFFNARERGHLADVHRVVLLGLVAVGLSATLLIVAWLASRGSAWFWQSVRNGALALATGAIVAVLAFTVLFDLAFEIFHRLFFASGTYSFDSRTDRLVQVYPLPFWEETTVSLAIVGLVLTLAVAAIAHRRHLLAMPVGSLVAGPAARPETAG